MRKFRNVLCSFAAPAAVAVMLTATPAFAQQAEEDDKPQTVDNADVSLETATEEEELILVTGSRIRLPNLENFEPTVSVDADYIESRNLTNVADALNEIPGFRGSVTPAGAQGSFGQGVNFINSFGIGTNRSLTLLNGRRVVSSNPVTVFGNASPGTQVDLNIIPTILVDRIDRVAVGGAPVYGSDAIAGTVNVILKRRFDGLQVRATTGLTDYGDNFRWNISGAYGVNFADGRANFTVAGSYEEVDGVLANSRDYFRANLGGLTNPSAAQAASFGPAGRTPQNDGRINSGIGFNENATDGFPGSVLVRNVVIPSLSRGGVVANIGGLRPLDFNVQFDPSGNLIPYNRGTLYGGTIASTAARSSGGDGFTFNDFAQITSNLRRISANAFFTYDLTEDVRFFAEGMYFQGRGDELVQQPTFNSTLFTGASGALTFSVDNPFLTAQARNLLVANGYNTFRLSRVNLDLADITGFSKNDLYRGVAGIDGDFQFVGRDFNFEVAVTYGRNDFVDFNQGINQQNFVNAINVARVNGNIVCTATPAVNATPGFTPVADANCVPLNLFGEGVASQAALDYIIEDVRADSRLEQFVVNANVGGSFFDIFTNPVAFNVGFEHREEKASFTPDAFQQAGRGRSVAIGANSGSYKLNEVFGEVIVPIVAPVNAAFIHRLEVFGRGRYVDNTVNGGFFSWAAGGAFAPIQDVEFRGNYTKSFRAPAITELFSPVTNTFTTVPDLCSTANRNAGPVPEVRARNCAAFLAAFPNSTPLAASLATVPGRTGGNPNLENEEAESYSFGVILRPRWVEGLSIAVDYIDIKISNPIASLTVAQIASGCFDNETFNTADPANGNGFCSQIRRDADGQVPADAANPAVSSGFVNGQRIEFSGIQGTLDYETKLDNIGIDGTFEISGDLFYLRRRLVDTTGVAPARSDGVLGDPEFQGQLRLGYFSDSWGMTTNVNYVGEQLFSRFNRGTSPSDIRELDELNDYITIDSGIYFETEDDFRLSFTVTNLTNRIGQNYFGFIHPSSFSDALGRRYAVSIRKNF